MTDRHEFMKTSLTDIIDEADAQFYSRHPECKGRKLTTSKDDDGLRSEWNEIFCSTALRHVKQITHGS